MANAAEGAEVVFQLAAEWMRNNKSLRLSNDQKLSLYGVFKQASEGPCNTAKPGIFDMTGRAKWEAWHKLGSMSPAQAMLEYVDMVKSLAPSWRDTPPSEGGGGDGREKRGGGPVVSTLMNDTEEVPDENKNAFDWCKEGHMTKLALVVTESNINSLDEQGMSLLHWACDRGHLEVVRWLVDKGAEVNQQDRDLQTPLHYAASCGHREVVKFLTSIPSVNKYICDCDGTRPLEITSDPSIRELLAEN